MRVRISRTWQAAGWSLARFEAGQLFKVRPRLAIYLLALHCAELE